MRTDVCMRTRTHLVLSLSLALAPKLVRTHARRTHTKARAHTQCARRCAFVCVAMTRTRARAGGRTGGRDERHGDDRPGDGAVSASAARAPS
jgi:hypothetical protein